MWNTNLCPISAMLFHSLRPVSTRVSAYLFALVLASVSLVEAQTLTRLAVFNGSDGQKPVGGLVQGFDGNFYGVTAAGGPGGKGEVFRVTSTGTLSVYAPFMGTKESEPLTGVVVGDPAGNLYGVTNRGGSRGCQGTGCGTVYRVSASSGAITTLAPLNNTRGTYPDFPPVLGPHNQLYGTTGLGGSGSGCGTGCGTVFRLGLNGNEFTILANLDRNTTGWVGGGLVLGTDGNLYGVTQGNTDYPCTGVTDCVTVFKLTLKGTLTTLTTFNGANGDTPGPPLVEGLDGNFYGVTFTIGGSHPGSVFCITPTGQLTTLYTFSGPDGAAPNSPLVLGTDGNFYGTTMAGGSGAGCSGGCGTLFRITPEGLLTTLANFDLNINGASPAWLVQGPDGAFYGMTAGAGGPFANGTVFKLDVGLGPFVLTSPSFGNIGSNVSILGNNLAGATTMKFNGQAVIFKVHSSTQIIATVPSGATSGTVMVTTPEGTLESNRIFAVIR